MTKITLTISNLLKQMRVDIFLVNELKISRNQVNKLLNSSDVYVNGTIIPKPGYMVFNGDTITIDPKQLEPKLEVIKKDIKVDIVYEDDYLIVINKPKGLLVHGTSYDNVNTLVNILSSKINKSNFVDKARPGIVHRLDKDTNGLMLVAKTQHVLEALSAAIGAKEVVRKYIAIVHNHFNQEHIMIKAPIARSVSTIGKMIVTDDCKAKEAITEIKLIKNLEKNQLATIQCILHTGRTHQIRVHLRYIQHPVYNDALYGKNDGYKTYGQFLTANELFFIHPITKKPMNFKIETDKHFNQVIKDNS